MQIQQSPCDGQDRRDNIDGWGSPVMTWIQAAFHPYLLVDTALYANNPIFVPNWPTAVETMHPGADVNRAVVVFNDGVDPALTGPMALTWTLHWNSPQTPALPSSGQAPVSAPQGFHTQVNVSFVVPAAPPTLTTTTGPVRLYFVLRLTLATPPFPVLNQETRFYMLVDTSAHAAMA